MNARTKITRETHPHLYKGHGQSQFDIERVGERVCCRSVYPVIASTICADGKRRYTVATWNPDNYQWRAADFNGDGEFMGSLTYVSNLVSKATAVKRFKSMTDSAMLAGDYTCVS